MTKNGVTWKVLMPLLCVIVIACIGASWALTQEVKGDAKTLIEAERISVATQIAVVRQDIRDLRTLIIERTKP